MGIPRIAASASAPMYRLERITATGSIAGDPAAGDATACWLAWGTVPLLGLFESAISCSLSQIDRMRREHAGVEEPKQVSAPDGGLKGSAQRTMPHLSGGDPSGLRDITLPPSRQRAAPERLAWA